MRRYSPADNPFRDLVMVAGRVNVALHDAANALDAMFPDRRSPLQLSPIQRLDELQERRERLMA